MKRPMDDITASMAASSSSTTTLAAANPKPLSLPPIPNPFLTKAQREQLALRRRQDEIADQKHLRQELLLSAHRPSSSDSAIADANHDRERDKDRDRHHRDRDRDRDREREREGAGA